MKTDTTETPPPLTPIAGLSFVRSPDCECDPPCMAAKIEDGSNRLVLLDAVGSLSDAQCKALLRGLASLNSENTDPIGRLGMFVGLSNLWTVLNERMLARIAAFKAEQAGERAVVG